MTSSSHALTGAAIGLAIQRPLLAIPLAFISHFILDALPHFDFGAAGKTVLQRNQNHYFRLYLLVDRVVLAVVLLALPVVVGKDDIFKVWACCFAAISPDLVWGWRFVGELKTKVVKPVSAFSRFHKHVQWKEQPWGLGVEIGWMALMTAIIGFFSAGK